MAYKSREDNLAYHRKYNATRRGTKEQRQSQNKMYYQKNKARAREYYENNKEEILVKKAKKYDNEKEHLKEIALKSYYRCKNTAAYKERMERTRESRNKYHRQWNKTTKGKWNSVVSRYRRKSRKLDAEGSFAAEDIKDLYATQGGRCYYCSVEIANGYHIEHMTPLSRGGMNDVSNICLACAPCNCRKHTKTAEEFQYSIKGEIND